MVARRLLTAAVLVLLGALSWPASQTPPAPAHYFNDYAGLVSAGDASRLDDKLRQFEQQTSSQIVVAIFPELPSPSLEDFTVTAAQAWRVGQKKLDNGAVLFVFVKDHKLRIEVGYGLEGALPDLLAKRIIDQEIVPAFRAGDPARGLTAGIDAMIAATRGEYKAMTPRVRKSIGLGPLLVLALIAILFLILASRAAKHGAFILPTGYGRTYGGRGSNWGGFGGGGGWGGGGFGGGGGGGGFGGGGGSFGGGGASGSW
jgi:uncharacterized protein